MQNKRKLVAFASALTMVSITLVPTTFAGEAAKMNSSAAKTTSTKTATGAKTSKTASGKITEAKALDLVMAMPDVKQFFKNVTKSKVAKPVIDVDRKEGNAYVVHVYEVVNDGPETSHTATKNWYYVDINTGKITTEF
ncbi:MAG: hypothetical protein DKT66_00920 [Candidatus Melainabacteria bacterium]|nr:MAG: hypothetical protein DKT66_00920 [Candidatus Melainabacteria bacterium]